MNMGSFESFLNMTIFELLDVCKELNKMQKEAKEASEKK